MDNGKKKLSYILIGCQGLKLIFCALQELRLSCTLPWEGFYAGHWAWSSGVEAETVGKEGSSTEVYA